MKDIPTPETIRFIHEETDHTLDSTTAQFCIKLEQERNLAREEVRIAVGLLSTHPQFAKFHPEEVLEMVKLEAAK